jgi:hypothetical protein
MGAPTLVKGVTLQPQPGGGGGCPRSLYGHLVGGIGKKGHYVSLEGPCFHKNVELM